MAGWKTRLIKSNNETLSIFVSTSLSILALLVFGFSGILGPELIYSIVILFAFISANSYLGKAIGKIMLYFKGEETNFIAWLLGEKKNPEAKPRKNIEGFATALAFLAGMTLGIFVLIFDPTHSLGPLAFLNTVLAKSLFVWFSGGLSASLFSRVTRLVDQSEEERKKSYFYNLFVIATIIAALAVLFFASGILFTGMLWSVPAVLTTLTVISVSVSMMNYVGKVIDQVVHGNVNNETLATMAGIGLGVVLGVLIVASAFATCGITAAGVVSAIGFSSAVTASLGSTFGQIAFVFFFASITTGFCRRIGSLFQEIFSPHKTIFDDLFVQHIKATHKLPFMMSAEENERFQRGFKLKEEEPSSIEKITKLFKQVKPGYKASAEEPEPSNVSQHNNTSRLSISSRFRDKAAAKEVPSNQYSSTTPLLSASQL